MRRITPERFYSQSWLETKEAERKAEERWAYAGPLVAITLVFIVGYVVSGFLFGGLPPGWAP